MPNGAPAKIKNGPVNQQYDMAFRYLWNAQDTWSQVWLICSAFGPSTLYNGGQLAACARLCIRLLTSSILNTKAEGLNGPILLCC